MHMAYIPKKLFFFLKVLSKMSITEMNIIIFILIGIVVAITFKDEYLSSAGNESEELGILDDINSDDNITLEFIKELNNLIKNPSNSDYDIFTLLYMRQLSISKLSNKECKSIYLDSNDLPYSSGRILVGMKGNFYIDDFKFEMTHINIMVE